jgi:hypothetical protein
MWSKTITTFLISINIKGQKELDASSEDASDAQPRGGTKKARSSRFTLWFALPAPLLLMLVDMAEDWAILFTPFVRSRQSGRFVRHLWTGVRVAKALMMELCFETGPTDFVDVDVQEAREKVRVRVLTR